MRGSVVLCIYVALPTIKSVPEINMSQSWGSVSDPLRKRHAGRERNHATVNAALWNQNQRARFRDGRVEQASRVSDLSSYTIQRNGANNGTVACIHTAFETAAVKRPFPPSSNHLAQPRCKTRVPH